MASSIVESPIARGGRPCFGRFAAGLYWTPPQPAVAAAGTAAITAAAAIATSSRCLAKRLTRRRSLARADRALPHRSVRDLLPDRPRPVVVADAPPAALEAVHPRRELPLLRVRELEVLPAPGGDHARQPGGGEADPPRRRRRAAPQVERSRGGGARPGRAGRLQVLRVLRAGHRRRARRAAPRPAGAAAHDRAAGRRELLHVPGD